MSDPTDALDSFGNARFTEDFRSEVNYNQNRDDPDGLQRQSTLKKKSSFKHGASVRRSRANSAVDRDESNPNSVLHVPIPTQNSPTEVLAQRFQAWRRLLKDYIDYFREVQSANETQVKSLLKLSQTISNQSHTTSGAFKRGGGILETNTYLRSFHSDALATAENARTIESEIINNLIGLRGDLALKIKEIKGLSGDFKNNVDKEKEITRKSLAQLNEVIQALSSDPQSIVGKNEPFIAKLQVEKQIRRQLSEENYLHRAYINLEHSGRELEKIVVAEIQKAFGTYSQLIRREGAQMINTAETMEKNIVQIPSDIEWDDFVHRDPNMVDPNVPLRTIEDIQYPGYNHPSTVVIRAGQLERRTKYLKSYAPGWYVLSSTHLHEFKTADRTNDLTPIMSLYLPDCTVGSFSEPAAVSHKFVLRGRQAGALHTRHSWTFRAESHATMLEWYEDIKKLTHLSGPALDAFLASHLPVETNEANDPEDNALLENDEGDEVPYTSATFSPIAVEHPAPIRPDIGRFPSDIRIERGFAESTRPASSGSDRSVVALTGGAPESYRDDRNGYSDRDRYVMISANPVDPNNPRHHSRTPSDFSVEGTHYDDSPVNVGVSPHVPNPAAYTNTNTNTTDIPYPSSAGPQGAYSDIPTSPINQNQGQYVNFVGGAAPGLGALPEDIVAIPPVPVQNNTLPIQAGVDPNVNNGSGGQSLRGAPSFSSIATKDIHIPGDYPRENY
jgi:hypothetical protein